MRRRDVLALIGGAAAWPFAALAQAPAMPGLGGRGALLREADVQIDIALEATRLQLLRELVPRAATVAMLVNPRFPEAERQLSHAQDAAGTLRAQFIILNAGTESEIDAAFAELVHRHAGALLIGADPFFSSRRDQFVELATRHAVPTMYSQREFVAAGGLVSYGLHRPHARRDMGVSTGHAPADGQTSDLLIIQAAKIELVINLKTAKTLGLEIPLTLMGRADEVIE